MNKYVKTGIYAIGGAFIAAILTSIGKNSSGKKSTTKKAMSKKYDIFFATALKGESHTYNDYNWKRVGGYSSFLYGKSTKGNIPKKLTDSTIGEILNYQKSGALYAVGRYQMIPVTLSAMFSKTRLKTTDKFDEANQDIFGEQLVKKRLELYNYINGLVPDTTANLTKAALGAAMEWSSIGVPYNLRNYKGVARTKNQSYYEHDSASVTTEQIQKAIKEQRKALGK